MSIVFNHLQFPVCNKTYEMLHLKVGKGMNIHLSSRVRIKYLLFEAHLHWIHWVQGPLYQSYAILLCKPNLLIKTPWNIKTHFSWNIHFDFHGLLSVWPTTLNQIRPYTKQEVSHCFASVTEHPRNSTVYVMCLVDLARESSVFTVHP